MRRASGMSVGNKPRREHRCAAARVMYGVSALSGLVLLVVGGCGARTEFAASELRVDRANWDTVHVAVSFVQRGVVGGDVAVEPEEVFVTVFDQNYETLYAGGPGVIALPDHRLGDRERLVVEACGTIRARQICLQEMLRSSPKRVEVEEEIRYPSGFSFTEGSYRFTFTVHRERFGGGGWERIDEEGVKGYLLAWVEGREAREKGAVMIPFTTAHGTFDLGRFANYPNFEFYLESRLLDERSARVHFEIHAGLKDSPTHLTTATRNVRRILEDERAAQIRYFVEQATDRIIGELGSLLRGRNPVAEVHDWSYNRRSRSYRISLRLEWEEMVADRGRYELEGVLDVREDGSSAVFRADSGNEGAMQRWSRRTGGGALRIGGLNLASHAHRAMPL